MRRTTFIAAAALLLGLVTSGQAQAESAPGCGPVTQIGKTAYVGDHGQKWASKDAREPYGHPALRQGRYRQQELWSGGTSTLNDCTSAYVEWDSGATTYRVRTDIRC
jgi:hypothetical protein